MHVSSAWVWQGKYIPKGVVSDGATVYGEWIEQAKHMASVHCAAHGVKMGESRLLQHGYGCLSFLFVLFLVSITCEFRWEWEATEKCEC